MNGTAPVTPVRLSTGVSTMPNGLADVPFGMSVSVTVIGPGAFAAPVRRQRDRAGDGARRAATRRLATTLTDRLAEPVPDAGLTCSHGWFDAAVHVTVPAAALGQAHDLRRGLRDERGARRHRAERAARSCRARHWEAT